MGRRSCSRDEIAEGNVLFAASHEAMDELAKAQQYQDRPQDELKGSCDSRDMAFVDLKSCMPKVEDTREMLDITRHSQEDAGVRTSAQERMRSQRDRCRRATKEHDLGTWAGSSRIQLTPPTR